MFYLSILSIFKNETMNLRLWLEHHLYQGVEHFYMIDNGSNDNPMEILQEYIDKGVVTYYYAPEQQKQVEHYRYIYDHYKIKYATVWLAVCDLDEFYYGVTRKLSTKIKSLDIFYDVVICNWYMFGHENLIKQPPDIRTAIVHREQNTSVQTKYIFKTRLIDSSQIWIHHLVNIGNTIHYKRIRIANKLIRINHYPIQSEQFFKEVKMTRGDVLNIRPEEIKDMNYFHKYNKNATYKDETLKNIILNPPKNYNEE
jgi:hypothetical protein